MTTAGLAKRPQLPPKYDRAFGRIFGPPRPISIISTLKFGVALP